MATEIVLPQWSMGMTDGTIVRWHKQEGETVMEGEPLVEVEAAKVTSEVEAEVSGVLTRILVAEGETVPIRTALCVIETAEEAKTSVSILVPTVDSTSPGVQVTPVPRRLAKNYNIDLSQVHGSGPDGRIVVEDVQRAIEGVQRTAPAPESPVEVQVIPAARRLAKEHGINLIQVKGSGPGGRITIEDVQRVITSTDHSAPSVQATSSISEQIIPLAGIRGTVARRMQQSLQTSAQVTLVTEVDVSALVQLREELKLELGLTYTGLIVKAVALALKEHPRVNAWIEGESLHLVQDIHIGVAVALDEGLIVPVVRNADHKSLREIAQETAGLTQRAREGSLTRAEVMDSTFSVSNLGMFGIDAFTPIVNPPEVAILGIGRINEKLMRVSRGTEWRQMMTLSLTFDHRAIDGVPAATFLQTIGKHLEHPEGLT
jgi:pyruvate dehydrogenase E2 component (dihydrolipoamide acetyltransferase)